MVFKQVHMRVLQDAVGADDAVDMGGFCTLHASLADMHMAFQNRAYGIPKQGIWCTMGTPPHMWFAHLNR